MATNNILTFAESATDILDQAVYSNDADRINGNNYSTSSVRSSLINKVLRQTAKISSTIAQYIVDISGQSVSDTDSIATVEANLKSALNQTSVNSYGETTLASQTTVAIYGANTPVIHVSGTNAISAFDTAPAGVVRTVIFDGALTINYNATSMILPSSANLTTAIGDSLIFVSEGSGNWRCVSYQSANGFPNYTYLANNYVANTAKGAANGVATLDANSKVTSTQIPATTQTTYGGVKAYLSGSTLYINL